MAEGEADYGLRESLAKVQTEMSGSFSAMLTRLTTALGDLVNNLTSLEVRTYTSDALDQVTVEHDQLVGAKLRAFTRVALDGDTLACVPVEGDQVDTALWRLHQDSVAQAMTHRAELLKSAAEATAGLLKTLGAG